ncbi:Sec-independent protein translocase protein TatA [Kocuria dechangensis]|uniref:Sec-independent protein translocase protein TatA n=1 Tax=Kocuria dechangensis TaxID=1176249 RepID=A0A917H5U1_9MICC|nr:Sec-independent protein translocase subunit TatA [Kocuria dechangensis]GGG68360.1 Sec-independent protein translocase protein TatA [Kocuria dechangensis]
MGRLFDSPVMLLIILLVILLLFGAPKLPGMARSLGQSMRIFKSEVKEMKKDDQPAGSGVVIDGEPVRDGQNVTPEPGPTGPADPEAPRNPDQRPGSPAA